MPPSFHLLLFLTQSLGHQRPASRERARASGPKQAGSPGCQGEMSVALTRAHTVQGLSASHRSYLRSQRKHKSDVLALTSNVAKEH